MSLQYGVCLQAVVRLVVLEVPPERSRREEAEDAVEVQPWHLNLLLTDAQDKAGHQLAVQVRQVLIVFRSVVSFFVGGKFIFQGLVLGFRHDGGQIGQHH